MGPRKFAAVVAVTSDFGIGKDGNLPWAPKRLHLDLAFLKFVTTHRYTLDAGGSSGGDRLNVNFSEASAPNCIIMGRKTWDSLPPKFKPMEGRVNIVITGDPEAFRAKNNPLGEKDVIATASLAGALEAAEKASPSGQVFVLGGTGVYKEGLEQAACECVFITRLLDHPPMACDAHFPRHALAGYERATNITGPCFELLAPKLPKSASVTLDGEKQVVREGEITYLIEMRTK